MDAVAIGVAEEIRAIEDIKILKARYFRYVDTKQWEKLRQLFRDDLKFWRGDHTIEPAISSADDFVKGAAATFEGGLSLHHGHMPEIEIDDQFNARGVWALDDWVDNFRTGMAFHGYGHYHETYRRESDGPWQISTIRITRLRMVEMPATDPAEIAVGLAAYYGDGSESPLPFNLRSDR